MSALARRELGNFDGKDMAEMEEKLMQETDGGWQMDDYKSGYNSGEFN
jgi:hypothetical protein